MHIDTILILSGISSVTLGLGVWVTYRLESIFRKFLSAIADTREDIASESDSTRTNLAGHIAQRSAEIIDQTAQATSVAATETHSRIEALSTHLSTHADDLVKQTEELKANARAIQDRNAVQLPTLPRAICPACKRLVYKYQRTASGDCFACDDCIARRQR